MMRSRRRLLQVAAFIVAAVAVVGLAIYLRKHAAPEPARLLPQADGVLYVNLRPLRMVAKLDQGQQILREPEYENFVRQTGFQFERDLDEVAFAVHLPTRTAGPDSKEARFTEIFVARFDSKRVTEYFRGLAKTTEHYRDVDIFSIAIEDRTVRVAILSVDTVAVSNHDSPVVMRHIINTHRKAALPFGGPAIVKKHLADVPLGSVAWAVYEVPPLAPMNRSPLSAVVEQVAQVLTGSTVVASLRYTGNVQLRIEALAQNQAGAQQLVETASTWLQLYRSIESSLQPGGPDQDVKALFDSIQVEQSGNSAILTAEVPQGFVRKIVAEPPAILPSAQSAPAPAPEKAKPAPQRGSRKTPAAPTQRPPR